MERPFPPRLVTPALVMASFAFAYAAKAGPLAPIFEPTDPNDETKVYQNSMRPGALSIDTAFPAGGSLTGTSALGLRFFLFTGKSLSLWGQYSRDNSEKRTSYGLTGRYQQVLNFRGRAAPFLFAQLSAGQNKHDAQSTTTPAATTSSELQAATAVGGGVEIFLLPELSTSVDIGFGAKFLPSSEATYTTATSQIALHYFLN